MTLFHLVSRVVLIFAFFSPVLSHGALFADSKKKPDPRCESAKEFITAYEYLRAHHDLAGSTDNAVKLASEVAEGCTGAAKRFIQSVSYLKKVELPLKDILTQAVELAKKEDVHVEAFNQIFKRAYAEDGFDLDLAASLKIAQSVSVEFQGPIENALKDFEKVSEFCLNTQGELFLPRPACAQLAERVARSGQEEGPAAGETFIASYLYLKNTVGLNPQEAQKTAEQLLAEDPKAFENFKVSYEYAVAEKGLSAPKDQAIRFAKKMADLTVSDSKTPSAK